MQLRLESKLSAEEYIAQRFWESASLPPCPKHPEGKCGFARHTAYERKSLAGAFIARGYCRLGHFTVSLLPDFLASRLPSTLAEVEQEVALVEASDGSIAASAARQHPTVGETDRVQGAERRLRRRSKGVRAALVTLVGLMPEVFAGHPPTLEGFREALVPVVPVPVPVMLVPVPVMLVPVPVVLVPVPVVLVPVPVPVPVPVVPVPVVLVPVPVPLVPVVLVPVVLVPVPVLVALRGRAAPHLACLPPPLGFGPRSFLRRAAAPRVQQGAGPAPPVPST